jgi:adenylate cyclase
MTEIGGFSDPVVAAAAEHLPDLEDTLRALGVPDDEVARAKELQTLELLTIERMVLPAPARYDVTEIEGITGVPTAEIVQLWRSLGFPTPRPGEKIFSDIDAQLLHTVAALLESGLVEPELAQQMSRVIGSSLARVASAMIDAIALSGEEDDGVAIGDFAHSAGTLLPAMPQIMDFVWRRHLQVAARRRILREGDPEHIRGREVVGFADLVGFTAMSQQITSQELAQIVSRFEAIAYDTVGELDGRVVKMIGDEVMFVVDDERRGLEIGLTLAELYEADPSLSTVRVGLAAGYVLEREADIYGPVVNLASRIVGIAFPGSVVVDEAMHEALADDPSLRWRSLRQRRLKDIGKVPLWTVRRADADEEEARTTRDRTRLRRAARADRAVEPAPAGGTEPVGATD